ncbi:MAG: Thiol:disulfide interchange protein DsbD [Gammaproteobacteria bacterium]|nr:Thiol:disulfide interchange protein DsbD [Gammaproteobacteria bacterium]
MKTLVAPLLLLLSAFAPGAPAAGAGDDPFAALKGLVGGRKEFLQPDRAFLFAAEAKDARTLTARWQVAEGYYLYRDKLTFKIEGQDVTLGAISVPPGEMKDDEYFGKVEIMHEGFAVDLPLVVRAGATAPAEVALTVGYQGCAEGGICYPPITKTVPVALNSGNQVTPPPPTSEGGGIPIVSETDRYTGLLSGGFSGGMLAAFFGVGLLLALTPCVFPMVPILSGILVGQKHTVTAARGLLLSSVYVVAMAMTYAAAGVLAGLFGQNLQAWFQQPAVLVGFALVFVALALSMFGLYDLQLPASWQSRLAHLSQRQRVGSLSGVAVMGVLSAVIVGPCVAPPLAGALVYIGQSGDALLGGAALFAMAMGMGMPLLVVGASAGHLLPRAGAWMEAVKRFFGVLMLAVAVWFLSRILPGPVTLALYALVTVVAATLLGAFHRLADSSSGLRRFGKGLGWAACLYGAALLLGALRGNGDPLQPLAQFGAPREATLAVAATSSVPGELAFRPVRGNEGLRTALQAASGKPVLLDVYADWCVECKKLDKVTFTDPEVRTALRDAVLLRADVTANDEVDQALLRELGLFGPPAILFFDANGRERRPYRLQGFVGPEPFIKYLATAIGRCSAPGQAYC